MQRRVMLVWLQSPRQDFADGAKEPPGEARRPSYIYLPRFSFSRCHFACVANKQGLTNFLGPETVRQRSATSISRCCCPCSHYSVLERTNSEEASSHTTNSDGMLLVAKVLPQKAKRPAHALSQTLSIFIQTPSSSQIHHRAHQQHHLEAAKKE